MNDNTDNNEGDNMTDESFEDHPEVHPEPDPDCNLCTLVALTRASMRVVELEAENEALRSRIDATMEHLNRYADSNTYDLMADARKGLAIQARRTLGGEA